MIFVGQFPGLVLYRAKMSGVGRDPHNTLLGNIRFRVVEEVAILIDTPAPTRFEW